MGLFTGIWQTIIEFNTKKMSEEEEKIRENQTKFKKTQEKRRRRIRNLGYKLLVRHDVHGAIYRPS